MSNRGNRGNGPEDLFQGQDRDLDLPYDRRDFRPLRDDRKPKGAGGQPQLERLLLAALGFCLVLLFIFTLFLYQSVRELHDTLSKAETEIDNSGSSLLSQIVKNTEGVAALAQADDQFAIKEDLFRKAAEAQKQDIYQNTTAVQKLQEGLNQLSQALPDLQKQLEVQKTAADEMQKQLSELDRLTKANQDSATTYQKDTADRLGELQKQLETLSADLTKVKTDLQTLKDAPKPKEKEEEPSPLQ